ncbi:hypothetical protein ACJPL8_000046 [Vibrio parahaemolyticus]|nr:hypothetical protein [Vibrio parahaemolyticus]
MDIEQYFEKIVHSVDADGQIEETQQFGYKLDGSDGLSVSIGFPENQLSKADYLRFTHDEVEIVELSDLSRQLLEANHFLQELRDAHVRETGKKRIPAKVDRRFRKEAFSGIKSELAQKWSGSIATVERLIRLKPDLTENPDYHYSIVCKDSNEIRAADHVITMMQGMCNRFKIINSSHY